VLAIGTSGWSYRDWRGPFYPPKLPQRLWLEHYAENFGVVELNNAFYRLPERATFEKWRERTPADFRFAVKMSRYLTHVKRLREPAEPVARFLGRTEALGDKLGPVLLQLPPTLKADLGALEKTLEQFPASVRVAVEPRHESWFTGELRELLSAHNAALSWADRLGRPVTPLWETADFGYLRLHEGPNYGRGSVASWIGRLTSSRKGVRESGVRESFVFFNNDPGGAAVSNARSMAAQARRRGIDAGPRP
jgi:uncharacterized protein YecE (DUF72 family)